MKISEPNLTRTAAFWTRFGAVHVWFVLSEKEPKYDLTSFLGKPQYRRSTFLKALPLRTRPSFRELVHPFPVAALPKLGIHIPNNSHVVGRIESSDI